MGAACLALAAPAPAGADDAAVARGEYLFRAAGGCTCHTADGGAPMSGGRPIETPFGVYYSTNITPDFETGIGSWSDADFARAMREGRAPNGTDYFPVFPYTSFTRMTDADVNDLKAYLFSLPPVRQENKPHAAPMPFDWRIGATFWKWAFFEPGRLPDAPGRDAAWTRGRYLAEALAHCGECHTPRDFAGVLDPEMELAGSIGGPEGELAPNITPDPETGIGDWSTADLTWFLQMGLKPDGDDTQGLMSEVIEHGYRHLRPDDLRAIATYLESVPAIRNRVTAPAAAED
jgi:mono/diheme cytochrome c family protein